MMLVIGIINVTACLPENFDIITPLNAQWQPSPLNCDVIDTSQKDMSSKLRNVKMRQKILSAQKALRWLPVSLKSINSHTAMHSQVQT